MTESHIERESLLNHPHLFRNDIRRWLRTLTCSLAFVMISALAPFDAIAEEEHHDMGAVGTNLANPLGTLWNLSFNIEPFKTKENMSEKKTEDHGSKR